LDLDNRHTSCLGDSFTHSDCYRHSHNCTHANAFTDTDGHSYRNGDSHCNANCYRHGHNRTNAFTDTNSYFYARPNNDAYAHACYWFGSSLQF
jgi:hypothetical protein